jgi:hypothetical protein
MFSTRTTLLSHRGAVLGLAVAGLVVIASGCNGAPSNPGSTKPEPAAAQTKPDKGKALAVGDKAMPFKLKDQAGDERSLDDLRKKGPVAVVFYRSAKW